MALAEHTFRCTQGETFIRPVVWKAGSPLVPVVLTGYTAKMQIRRSRETPILAELRTEVGYNGLITLDAPNGTVNLKIFSSATATLPAETLYYDLMLLSPGGDTTALLSGEFEVKAGITQ
jgi:hypothetical protein